MYGDKKIFKNNENISQIEREVKNQIKRIPRLDEKRIAIRQFIEEGIKLGKNNYDAIICPLYSGFVPAVLFQKLYIGKKHKKIPIFTFSAISSSPLNKKQIYTQEKAKFEIVFTEYGEKIISLIQKKFSLFLKKHKLNKNSKILFIDANIAKGFTLAYFVEVLKRLGLKTVNLTVVITDSRAEKKEFEVLPEKLFKGGKLVLFNQKNMTNKVFDNVLTPSCNIKKGGKKFKQGKMVTSEKQLTYYPYCLALALFKQEYKDKVLCKLRKKH